MENYTRLVHRADKCGFLGKGSVPDRLKMWLPRLACPECRGHLRLEAFSLICEICSRRYHINRGVPILLPDALRNIQPTEEENWQRTQAQLEKRYVDLDGDSFRQKMLKAAGNGRFKDTQNGFFWEKRLFRNLREHMAQRKGFFRSLQERNQLIICKLQEKLHLRDKIVLNLGPGADTDLVKRLEDEGAEVMNCDLTEYSLRYLASQKFELLTAGDIRQLPFQAKSFDLIIAMDILHHVHPISIPLKEIYRVLRERGTVCISELNKFNLLTLGVKIFPRFVRKWQRKLLRMILKNDSRLTLGSPYERILSSNEVTEPLNEIGFLNIEVPVLNYFSPLFPQVFINHLESIAARLPRVFDPIACRYFFIASK